MYLNTNTLNTLLSGINYFNDKNYLRKLCSLQSKYFISNAININMQSRAFNSKTKFEFENINSIENVNINKNKKFNFIYPESFKIYDVVERDKFKFTLERSDRRSSMGTTTKTFVEDGVTIKENLLHYVLNLNEFKRKVIKSDFAVKYNSINSDNYFIRKTITPRNEVYSYIPESATSNNKIYDYVWQTVKNLNIWKTLKNAVMKVIDFGIKILDFLADILYLLPEKWMKYIEEFVLFDGWLIIGTVTFLSLFWFILIHQFANWFVDFIHYYQILSIELFILYLFLRICAVYGLLGVEEYHIKPVWLAMTPDEIRTILQVIENILKSSSTPSKVGEPTSLYIRIFSWILLFIFHLFLELIKI